MPYPHRIGEQIRRCDVRVGRHPHHDHRRRLGIHRQPEDPDGLRGAVDDLDQPCGGGQGAPGADAHEVSLSGNRGTFSVTATANRSFAGKFVLVQRLAASGVVQLKKVVLGSASSATFTIRVQPGNSRLRAVMPTSQTQPGYSAAQSAVPVGEGASDPQQR
jgi:hypothetical protein